MAPEARVAVVNEAFARKHFRSSSPLGHRFRWDRRDPFDLEIVGIVRDAKYDHLKDDPPVTIYAPYTQSGWGFPERLSFAVRFAGNAAPAVAAVRRTMSEIDRSLPLTDMKTQQAQIDGLIVQERLFAWLISLFGAITLGLACVGLYGSIAASVTGRTREIGVRMALGAGKSAVLRMVLGQAALTAGLGIAAGLLATWASTRVVESLLFGVTPRDPLTLTLAAAAVLSIALAAACLPARRATCIDPVRALRYE
jgi:predicted lysophospholipase L1 biosynthesis ABC-type transport system permease subunit